MKVRRLALALAAIGAMLAPAAAPAATILQMNVDGGGNQAVPTGGFTVGAGPHTVTFAITPDPVGLLAGYIMNFTASGGAQIVPAGGSLCTQLRAGAADNCASTGTPNAIGTVETLNQSISTPINLISFTVDLPIGGVLGLAASSSVALDDFSEIDANTLLGGNLTLLTAIPEPGTVLLLGAGLAGLALTGRKRA